MNALRPRVLFALAALLTAAAAGFADDVFSGLETDTYACYLDRRGGGNFYRGYWYGAVEDGQHAFFLSNVDLDTGRQMNLYAMLGVGEDGLPEIRKIDGLERDAPSAFVQCLPDLLNFLAFRKNHAAEITPDCRLDDPWGDDYVQVFHYSSAAPFFGFLDMGLEGEEPVYLLDRAGYLPIGRVKEFFALRPLDAGSAREQDYRQLILPERPAETVPMVPWTIALDDRWKTNASLGYPGYWLQHESFRDSQVMLESSDWSLLEEQGLAGPADFLARVVPALATVDYRTFRGRLEDGRVVMECFVIDEGGTRNYQRLYCWVEQNVFFTLNFSSFASLYEANKPYYEAILDSFFAGMR